MHTDAHRCMLMFQLKVPPPIPPVVQTVGPLPPGVTEIPGVNTCKKCKNHKKRGRGVLQDSCPNCKMFWCLKDNCTEESTSKQSVSSHVKAAHINKTALNECSHCGNPKIRGNWKRKQCPQCHVFWCNGDGGKCKLESRSVQLINQHMHSWHNL